MKKEKIMQYFILLLPIIDFITSISMWEGLPSIGVYVKSFLLFYGIYFLIFQSTHKKENRKIFLLLGGYVLLFLIYWFFKNKSFLVTEVTNLIKIFYLPLLIWFFTEYSNRHLNSKAALILSLEYLMLYLVPYIFHIGHNMNELYPNKYMYLSYFYIGNELANVFILLIPIGITNLLQEKQKAIYPYLLLTLMMLYLLGTKALYLSVLIIIIYFVIKYHSNISKYIKKYQKSFCIGIILIITGLILLIPRTSLFQNIATTLEFYNITSIKDLINFQNIDHVIFSNRLTYLKNIHTTYSSSDIMTKIMGSGRTNILMQKDIEIDCFDIFYSIGLLGFLVYLCLGIYLIRKTKLQDIYKFLFILLLIISFFTGHILMSPMVSTYMALLFQFSKQERSNKNETLRKSTMEA